MSLEMFLRQLRRGVAIAQQALRPDAGRVYREIHGAIAPEFPLPSEVRVKTGREPLWINLGYWRDVEHVNVKNADRAPELLVRAQQDLARLLANRAGLDKADRVLDCGFGFGDQDVLWIAEYGPRHILGLNITGAQVEVARRRIHLLDLSQRIDLRHGSATTMPVDTNAFDVVFALECAFHFDTRLDFLREAFRVLRPGGRLVAADIIMSSSAFEGGPLARVREALFLRALHVPAANYYNAAEYRRLLTSCGFHGPEIASIGNDVWRPFHKTMAAFAHRGTDAKSLKRLAAAIRTIDRASIQSFRGRLDDYVLVYAEKPSCT